MLLKSSVNSYRLVNFIFIALIIGIFIYSGLNKNGKGIPSNQLLFFDEETLSTGLTRGFSSILKLEFQQALNFNPYSIRIFLFFLLQLLLRIITSFTTKNYLKPTIILDSVISISLFLICFWPFIADTFFFN